MRRIDERRDQDHRRPTSAAIAKRRPFNLAGDRSGRRDQRSVSAFVIEETGHGGARQLRVALGGGSQQVQKQWQRPRRVFMLQCTIIR